MSLALSLQANSSFHCEHAERGMNKRPKKRTAPTRYLYVGNGGRRSCAYQVRGHEFITVTESQPGIYKCFSQDFIEELWDERPTPSIWTGSTLPTVTAFHASQDPIWSFRTVHTLCAPHTNRVAQGNPHAGRQVCFQTVGYRRVC